jgi:hypothetical protein
MILHIVRVENGHTPAFPRSECISPVTEPRYTYTQVLLSGLLASLLLRAGRMLNVMPKNAGPETLNLFCAPLPNGGLSYVGLVSETPASYAASTSLHHGMTSDVILIFQTTSFQKERNTESSFKFWRSVTCLTGNVVPTVRRIRRAGLRACPLLNL